MYTNTHANSCDTPGDTCENVMLHMRPRLVKEQLPAQKTFYGRYSTDSPADSQSLQRGFAPGNNQIVSFVHWINPQPRL